MKKNLCLGTFAIVIGFAFIGTPPASADEKGVVFGTMNFIVPKASKEISINDIFLYDNDKHVELGGKHTQFSGNGISGHEFKALFDGNPATVFSGKKYAGRYLRMDFWVRSTVTRMVVVSDKPETLKGVQVEFCGDFHKRVKLIDLSGIPSGVKVAEIDLTTGQCKALAKAPTLPVPPPYKRVHLNELVKETLPLDADKRPAYASFVVHGPRPGIVQGVNEFLPGNDGILRCKGTTGYLRFNKSVTLEDGDVFGMEIDLVEGMWPGKCRPTFTFGKAAFRIERFKDMLDANGDSYATRTKEVIKDWRTTITFHRRGDVIDWAMFGQGYDSCGSTKCKPGALGKKPAIKIQIHQPGNFRKYKDPRFGFGIVALACSKPSPKLLLHNLPKALCFGKWPAGASIDVSAARARLKKEGINLPKLKMTRLYGPLQKDEVEALKLAVTHCPMPQANSGNRLIFGNEQDMAGVAKILDISNERVLLDTLYKWSVNLLQYRNDMPKGAHLPNIIFMWWNRPTDPNEVCKSWNYHGPGGWGWCHEKPHLGTEISGAGGAAAMMHFPLYVSRHRELWGKTIPGTNKTYLEGAKFLARESQAVMEDFIYKYYIEPDTGIARNKPWNRYTQTIETCMNLTEVYDNMKDQKDFYNKAKRDKCKLVVDAFVDYFFNPKYNYTFYSTKGRDGDDTVYAVGNWQYMPCVPAYFHPDERASITPKSSEDLGHGSMEVDTLGQLFTRGIRPDKVGLAFAHEFANTVRQRIYGGRNKKGEMTFFFNIKGHGKPKPGHIYNRNYLWPALVNPDIYEFFLKDRKPGGRESIASYCGSLWLRQELYKRGITGPGEENRKGPALSIVVEKEETSNDRVRVTLRAEAKAKPGSTLKSIEWDFNRDGKPDAVGERVSHTWSKAEGKVFQVVVLARADNGYVTSKDKAFVFSAPGKK